MFTTFSFVSLFIAFIRSVVAQSGFQIDTPLMVQCQSTQINWTSSGHPPYDLLIVSAQDVCGEALEDLGNQTSTSLNWTVILPSGTQAVLSLLDLVGDEAWSGIITVGNSNDTSCLGSTTSASDTTSAPLSISTPVVSGTPLAVHMSGGAATTTSSSRTSSASTSASQTPTSGALSTGPLNAVTLFSSVVLAVVAFAL